MAKQLQLRRGTALEHQTFIGADGEVTVVTDDSTLRVHDGVTPGGHPIAGTATSSNGDFSVIEDLTVAGTSTFNDDGLVNGDFDVAGQLIVGDLNVHDEYIMEVVREATAGQNVQLIWTDKDETWRFRYVDQSLSPVETGDLTATNLNSTGTIKINGNVGLQSTTTNKLDIITNNTSKISVDQNGNLQMISGQISYASQTLTDTANVAIDITANIWYLTTTDARIISAPTGGKQNTTYTLILTTNDFTPSWNSVFKFENGIQPTALTGTCIFEFFTPDGTAFHCTKQVKALS